MKHYPRGLNRFVLLIISLVFLAIAALTLGAAFLPIVAKHWEKYGAVAKDWWTSVSEQSTIIGTTFSWMSVALIALAVILVIIALVVIFNQGGGRTSRLADPSADSNGRTVADEDFLSSIVDQHVEGSPWVHSVSTRTFEDKKGRPRLALDFSTFKGAQVDEVTDLARTIVADLDNVLGEQIPVYVHIGSNWQTAIASRKRVK